MCLPVDISRGTEEDEEKVQEGVASDEGQLTDITKVQEIRDLCVSQTKLRCGVAIH